MLFGPSSTCRDGQDLGASRFGADEVVDRSGVCCAGTVLGGGLYEFCRVFGLSGGCFWDRWVIKLETLGVWLMMQPQVWDWCDLLFGSMPISDLR